MNEPGFNGIEIDVAEALEHNYTPEEAIAVQGLLHLNPSNLSELLLVQCNLTLLSSDTGFFKYCSAADVDDHQQRFLIRAAHAKDHILPHVFPGQDPRKGVPIRVYLISDGTYCYYPLLFKQRRCDNKYAITHTGFPEIGRWSHVCQAIGLNPGDGVKMWVLLHLGSRELCIFIAKQVAEG